MDNLSERAYMTLVCIATGIGFVGFFGGFLYVAGLMLQAFAEAGA